MAISKLYGNKIAIDNSNVTVDIVDHDGSTKGLMLGGTLVTATAAELNSAANVSARVQELTASGAVTSGIESVELNHATVIVAATVAAVIGSHDGIMIVKNTSASGTAAHTVTLTGGTWDGTNTIVTLDAPNEAIMVYFDSAGDGTIIENVGTVALS